MNMSNVIPMRDVLRKVDLGICEAKGQRPREIPGGPLKGDTGSISHSGDVTTHRQAGADRDKQHSEESAGARYVLYYLIELPPSGRCYSGLRFTIRGGVHINRSD